jgi:hypothetical protein
MNNRIKMTDSKFKCNIFLFLSVTVFMARLSIKEKKIVYSFVVYSCLVIAPRAKKRMSFVEDVAAKRLKLLPNNQQN